MRVFISHGCKQEDERQFLKSLSESLRGQLDQEGKPRFDVLYDRLSLRSGDRWRREIYAWMLSCQGAVIMLSRSAKKSRWVPRECMVLRWRKEIDPAFRLHMVLTPGFTRDDLKARPFDDLGLEDLNFVGLEKENDLWTVVEALKNDERNLPADDIVTAKIEEIIKDVKSQADERRFTAALSVLKLDFEDWDKHFAPLRKFALGLTYYAFREIRRPMPSYPGVSAVATLKGPLNVDQRKRIFDLLEPAWVDRCAAARLFHEMRATNRRVILLTASDWFAAKAYTSRAWSQSWEGPPCLEQLVDPQPEIWKTPGEALKMAVLETARPLLLGEPSARPLQEIAFRLEGVLKKKDKIRRPVGFCVLDSQAITIEQLIELQKEMPYIALIYVSHRRKRFPSQKVCLLRPILRASVERQVVEDRDYAFSEICN